MRLFETKSERLYRAERDIQNARMRRALFEMVWIKAHEKDRCPQPAPMLLSDGYIRKMLKEIIFG